MKIINNIRTHIERLSDTSIIISISIITFLAFSNIFFGHEFTDYDDKWYISENKNVINLSWKTIVNIFSTPENGQYSPIAVTYHAIIYYFFGANAIAFKFFAVLTHIFNSILVYKLFKNLSSNRYLIIFVTLVFAIHPMQVETISWLSAIFRIAATFMLLGFLFYCKYIKKERRLKYSLIFILFFILALFTKEQAILFPIGLLAINIKMGHSLLKKQIVIENIVLGLIVLAFGLITLGITKTGGPDVTSLHVSLYTKFYIFSESILRYIYNFLFPFNLSISYPYQEVLKPVNAGLKISSTLSLIVIGIITSVKNKELCFGIIWSIGFLSLALSFTFLHLRDTFMADRYAYLAIIGFGFILYYLLNLLHRLLKKIFIAQILGIALIVVFIATTFNRVTVFKNSETLWTDAIKVNNKNRFAHNNLGNYYLNHGELDRALVHLKKAIEISTDYYLAHSNISKVYYKQHKYELALEHINENIRLKPNHERNYVNRAGINEILKKYDECIPDLNHLIKLNPENETYLTARAKAYFFTKKYKECIDDAEKIIESAPKNSIPYYLIGHSYYKLKNYQNAEMYLTKAIQLKDNDGVYYNVRGLSRLFLDKGSLGYTDILKAKELGVKVNNNLLEQLSKSFKKN
ncbi:CDC27 family protein [Seonamhaeicola sp.]|uniref:CDC27 family protein n=1 Tax=Seonamhaeicola sp. TaxID=1912245 RepID=UPI00262BED85|nr:CDC27 family protein [Seonamhaeicola sp.]